MQHNDTWKPLRILHLAAKRQETGYYPTLYLYQVVLKKAIGRKIQIMGCVTGHCFNILTDNDDFFASSFTVAGKLSFA